MIRLDRPFLRSLIEDIASGVMQSIRASVRESPDAHPTTYLAGLSGYTFEDEIVIRLKGLVPNFIEHGLGPGGLGTEGAFDIRANVLKNGKTRQAIPVAPGVFRMMSLKGKPWIHPGFKAHNFLRRAQEGIPQVIRKVFASNWD